MSLINQMLKDIDARHAAQRSGAGDARRLVAGSAGGSRSGSRWLAQALGATVLLLLAVVGWLLFSRPTVSGASVPIAARSETAAAPAAAKPAVPPQPASAVPGDTAREGTPPVAEPPAVAPTAVAGAPKPLVATTAPEPAAEPGRAASMVSSPARAAVPETKPKPPVEAAQPAAPAPVAVVAKTSRAPVGTQQAERLYQEAYGLLGRGRTVEAEASLREALRADSRHRAAREQLAGILMAAGRWVELRLVAAEGLAADAGYGAMAELGARAALEQGDAATAIELLERTAAVSPQEPPFYALLAATYQQVGRFGDSANLYQRLIMKNPQQATWWAGFAIALDGLGSVAEAREAYRNALARGGLPPQLQLYARERLGALGDR